MKGLGIVATSTPDWLSKSRKAKIEQLETCVDIFVIIFEQSTTRQNNSARFAQHVIGIMLVIMRLHHACWMLDNLDFVLILSNSFRSLKRMRGKDSQVGEKINWLLSAKLPECLLPSLENSIQHVVGCWTCRLA